METQHILPALWDDINKQENIKYERDGRWAFLQKDGEREADNVKQDEKDKEQSEMRAEERESERKTKI